MSEIKKTKFELVKPYSDLSLEELAKIVRRVEYENETLKIKVDGLLSKIEQIRTVLKNL